MTKLLQRDKTIFVALPYALQRAIPGGCQCPHCKADPLATPRWDTLAIDADNPMHTWTVHYPELHNTYKTFIADACAKEPKNRTAKEKRAIKVAMADSSHLASQWFCRHRDDGRGCCIDCGQFL